MFLFGKLPAENEQEPTMANKEESFSEKKNKIYHMRKYQYKQFTTLQTTIQPFNAVTTTTSTAKPTRVATSRKTTVNWSVKHAATQDILSATADAGY